MPTKQEMIGKKAKKWSDYLSRIHDVDISTDGEFHVYGRHMKDGTIYIYRFCEVQRITNQ